MSKKVKTCIVFLKFKMKSTDDWTETYEVGEFGGEGFGRNETAYDFITEVRNMHRQHSHAMTITNVVIG
jgi:hypothetical protein